MRVSKHHCNIFCLLLFLGIGYVFSLDWGYYLLLVVLFLGILSWGVFDIRLSYFVQTQYHLKGRPKKTVLLSFDDGPTSLTPQFLDLLKQYNAKAVFFCIGKQVVAYPQIVRRIQEEGHLIGNHTYSHIAKNTFASTAQMTAEIEKTDVVLAELGIKTDYFRPPYGITNPHIARAAKATGKRVIGWDIRSLDTIIKKETRLLGRVLSKLSDGNIILMHDTSERSLQLLEQLLKYLSQNNYRITNKLE